MKNTEYIIKPKITKYTFDKNMLNQIKRLYILDKSNPECKTFPANIINNVTERDPDEELYQLKHGRMNSIDIMKYFGLIIILGEYYQITNLGEMFVENKLAIPTEVYYSENLDLNGYTENRCQAPVKVELLTIVEFTEKLLK